MRLSNITERHFCCHFGLTIGHSGSQGNLEMATAIYFGGATVFRCVLDIGHFPPKSGISLTTKKGFTCLFSDLTRHNVSL